MFAALAPLTGSLSATIPLSRISEVLSRSFTQGTFTIRLAVWQRPTDTQGLPGNRISAPFTVTMHPRSTEGGTEEGTALNLSPQMYVGQTWNQLDTNQQQRVAEALEFGDLSDVPTNKKIIDWLVANYLDPAKENLRFDSNTMRWIGEAMTPEAFPDSDPDLVGQCKWWVDDVVLHNAVSINLPANDYPIIDGAETPSYLWKFEEGNEIAIIAQETSSGFLSDCIQQHSSRSGDIIQYSQGTLSQTMIVGAKTDDGIWIFDSNFVSALTPSYRFVSNESLNSIEKFTIYRIQS